MSRRDPPAGFRSPTGRPLRGRVDCIECGVVTFLAMGIEKALFERIEAERDG